MGKGLGRSLTLSQSVVFDVGVFEEWFFSLMFWSGVMRIIVDNMQISPVIIGGVGCLVDFNSGWCMLCVCWLMVVLF